MYEFLVCPACHMKLSQNGSALRCSAGHSYDIARSGYVNLLPPGRRSNASTGDHDDMIRARRAFLARGHYDEYVRRVSALAKECLGRRCETALDAACGEGHHSLIIARELDAQCLIGVDASKKAADVAAKAARAAFPEDNPCTFAAGNIFSLPVEDSSVDVLTVLFAPIPFEEAHRVLKPDGILCVAGAAADHLVELRRLIYDEVRFKEKKEQSTASLTPVKKENVSYTVSLDGEELRELFEMTPFCHRCGKEGRERISPVNETKMTVSVDCVIYRKEINDENFNLHTDV